MEKEYIKLQHSHATQITNGHERSDWSIEANHTNEQLAIFPSTLTETQMFSILDFAKKYELEAWNQGIKFGSKKTSEVWDKKVKKLQESIDLMRAENERLAEALATVYDKLNTEE